MECSLEVSSAVKFETFTDVPKKSNQTDLCFICQQTCNSDSANDPGLTKHSLRFLCQYLKINSDSILVKIIEKSHENFSNWFESINANEDFTVLLCTSCSTPVTKIISLIQQLELTQMLLNYQLQTVNALLKPTETRENGTGLEDMDFEARFEIEMRQRIVQKCKFI